MTQKQEDGVFYSPDYLTEYIVRRTLLVYLRKSNNTENFDQLVDEYNNNLDALEKRINNLRILDSACGTGVFLVKTVEILMELYKKLHPAEFDQENIQLQIIKNNIFGIDLDLESVNITKSSLFHNPVKNKPITIDLGSHIRCGNCIITDTTLTSTAFDWKSEFSTIFSENGGFDIIIGNPPWGADIVKYKSYLKQEYGSISDGQADSFAIFLYQNIRDLLKEGGILGYILPNELCLEQINQPLRKYILHYNILELINLGLGVFEAVTKPSLILLLEKMTINERSSVKILVNLSKQDKLNVKMQKLDITTLYLLKGYSRNQKSFEVNDGQRFDIWATSEDKKIIDIIHTNKFSPFGKIVVNGRGIDTNKQGKYYVCPLCSYLNPPFGVGKAGRIQQKSCVNNRSCLFVFERKNEKEYQVEYIFSETEFNSMNSKKFEVPGFIGSDLQKFRFKRKPRTFRYYGHNKLDDPSFQRYKEIAWKKPEQYYGEKLLLRKVSSGNVPEIMYHDGFLVYNQQIYCFQKKNPNSPVSLKFYLSIIGSSLFHYYYTKQFGDPDKEVLPHFTQTKILQMPVPTPDVNSTQYQELLAQTNELLQLVEEYETHPESNIKNLIEKLFGKIENIIFSYYGITDELYKQRIYNEALANGFRIL